MRKHALGSAFGNGEDITAFDVTDSQPSLLKLQNRSFLEKVVKYSPLRHSLLGASQKSVIIAEHRAASRQTRQALGDRC